MFMTHLGITPDGLARSCRAHFARRLLDDTDLSMTEIAHVAGFGSVRQLKRVCLNYLVLRLHLPHWGPLTHLVARARRIASLDDDPSEPAWPLTADPLTGSLPARQPGIRIPGSWDPFEVGVSAILSQGL
jgi:3-methyladenine DNA glycosylase/8-oxoguanine DNA glycosylase